MIPRAGQPPVAVAQVRPDAAGARAIEVVMQAEARSQQWAVAVVSGALSVDWANEAAVAAAVPAATGALEETFGPIDPSNSAAASGHADKARDTKEASQRAASGGQRGGDGGLQNETSSLQDDGTPSPN